MSEAIIIPDQQERDRALDPTASYIIQAPAGSGKTELLTQRFLVLLATVNSPEEIIALTFTRKAASEMRQRIMRALNLAASGVCPKASHAQKTYQLAQHALLQSEKNHWDLLLNPNRLRVMTIDSLCGSLTKQMPLLSHLGANPDISVEPSQLYKQAGQRTLSLIESDNHWQMPLKRLLLHCDNNVEKLLSLLTHMLANREQWLPSIMSARQHDQDELRERLSQHLKNINQDALESLRYAVPMHLEIELTELLAFAASQLEANTIFTAVLGIDTFPNCDIESMPIWLALSELLLTKENTLRKQITKNNGFPAKSSDHDKETNQRNATMKVRMLDCLEEVANYPDFIDGLRTLRQCPPYEYQDKQWQLLKDLLDILPLLVAQLRVIFSEQATVDFNEMSHAAITALGEHDNPTELALRLDYQISHLLIDEFQDTSTSQMRLINLLTAGWDDSTERTVFLVGDPMQSIYRFRQANVGLFLQAWEHGLEQVALTPLTLRVNFRSQGSVVNWLNEHFTTIFPAKHDIASGAVSYSQANAIHPETSHAPVVYCPSTSRGVEAESIIQAILSIQSHSPKATIAILAQNRGHLKDILPALTQQHIDFQAIELESLAQKPCIMDLWSLTCALLHPADSLAWYSLLRAPWCGISLEDLYRVSQSDPKLPWDKILYCVNHSLLTEDGHARVSRFAQGLSAWIPFRQSLLLHEWVRLTWTAIGGPACLHHVSELEDVERFFDCIAQNEEGGTLIDKHYTHEQLEKLYANTLNSAENPVQIMTIHKSKGLEFDYVLIPGLDRTNNRRDKPLLHHAQYLRENGDTLLLFAPLSHGGQYSDERIYRYIQMLDSQQEAHEKTRLFYVAVTRAKIQCQFHYVFEPSEDEEPPLAKKGSLLSHLPREQLKPKSHSNINPALNTNLHWDSHSSGEKPVSISGSGLSARNDELRQHKSHTQPAFIRLSANWNLPQIAWPLYSLTGHNPHPDDRYRWRPDLERSIGTLLHRILAHVSTTGLSGWNTSRIREHIPTWKKQLLQLGIQLSSLDHAIQTIENCLIALFDDARARWVLSATHQRAHNEWALSYKENDTVINVVIDRTFICEDGYRWIIDYKTASKGSQDANTFLHEQKQLYAQQMQRYQSAILSTYETNPIRCALFFVTERLWVEV